jgi:hypothetical protein
MVRFVIGLIALMIAIDYARHGRDRWGIAGGWIGLCIYGLAS